MDAPSPPLLRCTMDNKVRSPTDKEQILIGDGPEEQKLRR
jgi:hypothetical protein